MSSLSLAIRSLYSIKELNSQKIHKLIELALLLKAKKLSPKNISVPPVVLFAFLEPSTRTRMSFDIAAQRLGLKTVCFTGDASTSLSKGESFEETIQNLCAMRPDLMVIRHSGGESIENVLKKTDLPLINAGNGIDEHPTQALLDAMTIFEKRGTLAGEKIVYVGDVEHSRVARSGRMLFEMMGAEVAVCAPQELMPKSHDWQQAKHFTQLEQALCWASTCIGLRIQKERHSGRTVTSYDQYVQNFRLDNRNLRSLNSNGIVMHPGPFVDGQDLNHEILSDPRCLIHTQVTNGVYMRMAVMGEIFGISYT